MKKEFRLTTRAELRVTSDGSIEGYTAVFDSPSEDLGGFTEVCRKGCFSRALKERQDVLCTFNHDVRSLLGRTAARTLDLSEDSIGLHFRCSAPATSYAEDLRDLIRRGDVSGCSFGFIVGPSGDRWPTRDRRELVDVELLVECGPVVLPAYRGTNGSLSARSMTWGGERFDMRIYSGMPAPAIETEDERERLKLRLRLAAML